MARYGNEWRGRCKGQSPVLASQILLSDSPEAIGLPHHSGSLLARELRSGCRLGSQPDFGGQGPSAGGREPSAAETARMAILQRRLGAPAISGPTNFRSDRGKPSAPAEHLYEPEPSTDSP